MQLCRASSGCLALALLTFLIGCDSGPTTYSVSGTVTYEGKPLTSGLINFRPPQGSPYGGGIQPDGTYEFQLPAGTYQVRIDAPAPLPEDYREGDPLPDGAKRLAPLKYASFGSSNLTATVEADGGTQRFDFELN